VERIVTVSTNFEVLKKRRTKLRKFLLRTLLFLLLLTGLSAVLLRSRKVQTLLAQKAAHWLSQEIGTKVAIRSVEFDFFRNLHLEGVYIEDKHGDTMIAAEVIDAQLKRINQLSRQIEFYSVDFTRANVHIGFHKGEDDQNLQFLIDYINGPERPKKRPKKVWSIHIDKGILKETRYVSFDEEKMNTEKGILDEHNLQFNSLNGTLKDLWIVDDSFHFEAQHLSTTERSGLMIREMNALCNVHNYGMDFWDLSLKTRCSLLKGEMHFKYPGFKHMNEFVSNTQWKSTLLKSSICLADISIFDQNFVGHPETLDVQKLDISGTFDHLHLNNTDIRMGNETKIVGDFYLEGLPNWRNTYCDFNVRQFKTNAGELSRILHGMELPQTLYDAGNIDASGLFRGRFLDFNWNGNVKSNFGELQTDVVLDLKNGLKTAEFKGKLSSSGFDLGIFNENLGKFGFDLELNGTGLDPETFHLDLNTRIDEFDIRGRNFSNAKIKGTLTGKYFEGSAVIDDQRINSSFNGKIDFIGKIPVFKFTAETKGIDLYALNLDTTNTLIWGKFNVDAKGVNLDDFVGTVDMVDVAIQRNGITYQFDAQEVSKWGNPSAMRLDFLGDFVTGNIYGKLAFDNVEKIANNIIANVFPDRFKYAEYVGKDSFQFNLKLPETAIIFSFLDTGMSTSALAFNGYYSSFNDAGSLNIKPFDFNYNQYKFKNLDLSSKYQLNNGLDFRISALEIQNSNKPQFLNVNLQGIAKEGSADFSLDFTDRTGEYLINLNTKSEVFADSITLLPMNSKIIMAKELWTVSDFSQITFLNNGRIFCRELYLDGKTHFIEAKGVISSLETDTLHVDFGNFGFDNLKPFLLESSLDSMEGKMNGTLHLSNLLGSPHFTGEIQGRNLKYYGQDFGNANLAFVDRHSAGRISADCEFVKGLLSGVSVKGSIGYDNAKPDQQLALRVEIPENTSLAAAQPFLKDIFTIKSGTLNGELFIKGSNKTPRLEGEVNLRNANIKIDYLNTNYILNGKIFSNKNGFFTKTPIKLQNEYGNGKAVAILAITHTNFDKFYLNIKIDSVDNLKVLNTTQRDNDLYFGTAYADGYCNVFGPLDRISMDIHLKNRKNSKISLVYSDLEKNDILGFIRFVKQGVDTLKRKKFENNVIQRIDISFEVNRDLEAEFLIDKQLGDVIKGRGDGILRMVYDENQNFFLYGSFIVASGQYVFSLPGINVITRKIELKQGGYIRWSGDPSDANLNLTGSFVKKISPAVLMSASGASSQKTYVPIKIESSLFMRGKLFGPDISFDIQAPDLESNSGGSLNDVARVIQRIRADKDETMRQAVALLLFGNFIPPSFSQSTNSSSLITGSSVAGNSLGGIATNVVNDIFTRLGIPTRIQVNIDDVKNPKGETNTKVFINSEWFLTERIRLDLNYDPTVNVLVSTLALPLNFNVEYLTRNENWSIKAFSRSSNLLLQTANSQGVSGNTLGIGVVYRREFDTLKKKKAARVLNNTNFPVNPPLVNDTIPR